MLKNVLKLQVQTPCPSYHTGTPTPLSPYRLVHLPTPNMAFLSARNYTFTFYR
jgi:hypothetical protein